MRDVCRTLVLVALLIIGLGTAPVWGQNQDKGAKKEEKKTEKKADEKADKGSDKAEKKADSKKSDKGEVSDKKTADTGAAPPQANSVEQEVAKVQAASTDIQARESGFWASYKYNFMSILGVFILLGIAYAFSLDRKALNKKLIIWGVCLQLTFAVLILHTNGGRMVFDGAKQAVNKVLSFTEKGSEFVLGYLTYGGLVEETLHHRKDVFVSEGGEKSVSYINGRPITNLDYFNHLKGKKKELNLPADKLLPGWKSGGPPPEIFNKPVLGLTYPQAYGYTQAKAKAPTEKGYFPNGFIFVFQVLTTIIFFSSFMGVLYHLGILQFIVYYMAKAMNKTMGTSGAESLSVAANVFVGQTEAPLVVRPYVNDMTQSELMALMSGGFATIAGGVLVAYVALGVSAGHLLAASIMSAPAALVMAKLFVPETEVSKTAGEVSKDIGKVETANVIDAAAHGAGEGMKLALNVAAMLLAFVALIKMADWMLGVVHHYIYFFPKDLASLFGYVFFPVAAAMGVPWEDCFKFSNLIGAKLALTEFIAYLQLTFAMPNDLIGTANTLSTRAVTLGTYALCGFANFGSIAIQIGGIGGIAPGRRQDLAKLGLRAMFAGALASFMTATVAGILLTPQECDWRYSHSLAERSIEKNLGKNQPLALADFAKPYHQYTLLYPGQQEAEVEGKVKENLNQILTYYSKQPNQEEAQFAAYRFIRIFQARYPKFSSAAAAVVDSWEPAGETDREKSFIGDVQKKLAQ